MRIIYANEIWAGDRWADGESVYPSRGVDLFSFWKRIRSVTQAVLKTVVRKGLGVQLAPLPLFASVVVLIGQARKFVALEVRVQISAMEYKIDVKNDILWQMPKFHKFGLFLYVNFILHKK